MASSNILKLFIEKGFLLDKEMLDFLNELNDREVANEIIDKVAVVSQKKLITKDLVSENIEKIKPILFELEDDKKKLVEELKEKKELFDKKIKEIEKQEEKLREDIAPLQEEVMKSLKNDK